MLRCIPTSWYGQSYGTNKKDQKRSNNYRFLLAIILCVIFVVLLLPYLSKYYIDTYLWQSTILAENLRPVSRTSCELPSAHHQLKKPKDRPVKIGLLMIYQNNDGGWPTELMERVLKNRETYAKKRGYHLLNGNDLINPLREPAWSKLIAAEYYLSHGYDYIVYIDTDIVIMNMDKTIEKLIEVSNGGDLIMTEDWSGPNTGVWIANNSPWTKKFLRLAFEQKQLDAKYAVNGAKHPFEYEQRAVHYLMNTPMWISRGLPTYKGDVEEIRRHIHMLPQCAMNSFSMHPFELRGNREVSHYIPGDFMIHFAGKKGKMKVDLLDYYLDLADRSNAISN